MKIYIDFAHFQGKVADDAVEVRFQETCCEVMITDEQGVQHIAKFDK